MVGHHTVGRTPDISVYLDFSWYDTLWYYDEDANFPQEHRKLVKWLGVADRVGQVLCYYILNERTRDIIRSTLQQFETNKVKVRIKNLDISIQERIDNVDLADISIELQDEYEILETLEPVAHRGTQ
jgi:hypothetical protein